MAIDYTHTPEWIQPQDPGMPKPEIHYRDDGETIKSVVYKDTKDQKHRDSGPAVLSWHENGTPASEQWYQHGKMHRTDGPGKSEWYQDGQKAMEAWYDQGSVYRAEGYAQTHWDRDGNITSEFTVRERGWASVIRL